jgi:hypothetical protein
MTRYLYFLIEVFDDLDVWGQVADEKIKPVVSEASEKAIQDFLADPPKLEDVLGSELPCFASRIYILRCLHIA